MPLTIRSCKPGISFFKLIDEIWWGNTGSDTLHRLCTMMRWMSAQSVVVEMVNREFDEFGRIYQEVTAIEKRLGSKVKWEARKLTFLRQKIEESDHLDAKATIVIKASDDAFLGYVIVVNLVINNYLKKTFVIESVTRDLFPRKATLEDAALPTNPPIYYLHVKKKFECQVLQRRKQYALVGAFFRQQNSITNVCAHACAVMMLNNCKEISELVTCEDINDILGIDHQKRLLEINKHYSVNYGGEKGVDTTELREKISTRCLSTCQCGVLSPLCFVNEDGSCFNVE